MASRINTSPQRLNELIAGPLWHKCSQVRAVWCKRAGSACKVIAVATSAIVVTDDIFSIVGSGCFRRCSNRAIDSLRLGDETCPKHEHPHQIDVVTTCLLLHGWLAAQVSDD